MSDCLGMCLRIIDNGISIGTSAWGICVYSISGGHMVFVRVFTEYLIRLGH